MPVDMMVALVVSGDGAIYPLYVPIFTK